METAGISTQTKNIRIFEIELQSLKMPRYKRTKRLISYRLPLFFALCFIEMTDHLPDPTPYNMLNLSTVP